MQIFYPSCKTYRTWPKWHLKNPNIINVIFYFFLLLVIYTVLFVMQFRRFLSRIFTSRKTSCSGVVKSQIGNFAICLHFTLFFLFTFLIVVLFTFRCTFCKPPERTRRSFLDLFFYLVPCWAYRLLLENRECRRIVLQFGMLVHNYASYCLASVCWSRMPVGRSGE